MADSNKWGYKNKARWVLIELAPYTASGMNEILFAAETKMNMVRLAKMFNIKVSMNGRYQIVNYGALVRESQKKEEAVSGT